MTASQGLGSLPPPLVRDPHLDLSSVPRASSSSQTIWSGGLLPELPPPLLSWLCSWAGEPFLAGQRAGPCAAPKQNAEVAAGRRSETGSPSGHRQPGSQASSSWQAMPSWRSQQWRGHRLAQPSRCIAGGQPSSARREQPVIWWSDPGVGGGEGWLDGKHQATKWGQLDKVCEGGSDPSPAKGDACSPLTAGLGVADPQVVLLAGAVAPSVLGWGAGACPCAHRAPPATGAVTPRPGGPLGPGTIHCSRGRKKRVPRVWKQRKFRAWLRGEGRERACPLQPASPGHLHVLRRKPQACQSQLGCVGESYLCRPAGCRSVAPCWP